jgi:ABC-type multidrug transport system ATPase subunit
MVATASATTTAPRAALTLAPAVLVEDAERRFGSFKALDGVSLAIRPGQIHALLGPNGAGKTTLLRLLIGLATPNAGRVSVLGTTVAGDDPELRNRIGFVPSGDRTFYERLSGEENLVFFARLHGLRKAAARRRAREVLAEVALTDAAKRRVSTYSHGMQKRLSVARALLVAPPVLLVDEATHDLDPDNAARVRELVAGLASRGSAVLWATQRIEEIRGFADEVTLIVGGRVRFAGAVTALLANAESSRFVLRVGGGSSALGPLQDAVGPAVQLFAQADPGHVLAELGPGVALGDVVTALGAAGAPVQDCRRERSEAEDAFLTLSRGDRP